MDEDDVEVERRSIDTFPLLMEHSSSSDHVAVTIQEQGDHHQDQQFPHTQPHQQRGTDTGNNNTNSAPPPSTSSSSSSSRSSRNLVVPRQRISPLNSGLWISIELTITVSQIVASIIVLSLSRDEKPQAPLSVWVAGYAAGCLATLPLLYWRYTHRHGAQATTTTGADHQDSPSQSTSTSLPPSPRGTSYVALTMPSGGEGESRSRGRHRESDSGDNSGVGRLLEKFKIALDCFFAVWFVVGNVWIFGGHSSSREAPNLYRLCIVFLTFSCIGYAMPFILCATICCCLPCIIALLGFREEQAQNRGAAPEVIAALPTYKFKARSSSEGKDGGSDSDSEGSLEGGIVAAGTDKERAVSADDAVCCICLARYKDGEPLRELACTHHFHVECVDKWLKINASCPLCKLDVSGGSNEQSGAIVVNDSASGTESRSMG